ncbi:MAG: hypothetical protein ACK5PF_03775 [bacterium]
MSDTMPGIAEAFPDKLHIFRRDRKMTIGDHVNYDPNDWQAYIRADTVQAQIDAAVKVERERCAKVADDHLERVQPDSPDDDMHDKLAQGCGNAALNIAAAIRKGDQP